MAAVTLTREQENEIRARFAFAADDVDWPIRRAMAGLHEIEEELRGIAEGVYNVRGDTDCPSEDEARRWADAYAAFSRTLGDLSTRIPGPESVEASP